MSYYHTHHLGDNISLPLSVVSLIKPNSKIIDIGCGRGNLKKKFPRSSIIGIDINPGSIKICKQLGYKAVNQVDISSKSLPYKDSTFDFAICIQVLEHLTHPLFAVKEIRRVLKNNGFAFFSVPTVNNKKYFDDYTHIRPFTSISLFTLLKDASFKKVTPKHQFAGIPGFGFLGKIFKLNIEPQKETIANLIPAARGKANIEMLAKK